MTSGFVLFSTHSMTFSVWTEYKFHSFLWVYRVLLCKSSLSQPATTKAAGTGGGGWGAAPPLKVLGGAAPSFAPPPVCPQDFVGLVLSGPSRFWSGEGCNVIILYIFFSYYLLKKMLSFVFALPFLWWNSLFISAPPQLTTLRRPWLQPT